MGNNGTLEPFFQKAEGRLESLFENTAIRGHLEIQKHILRYAFDLETCLSISCVNKQGFAFFRDFKRLVIDEIRSLGTLESQDWMHSDPSLWLAWLLTENEDGCRSMIPLDPRITMNIFFRGHRRLYPISYKRRICQERVNQDCCFTDPYVSVELSGISLSSKDKTHFISNESASTNEERSSFSNIYDMFDSSDHVFGVDVVYGRPYDGTASAEHREGGGEILVQIHPKHIFEVLSHNNFVGHLNRVFFFGVKEKYALGDWSGYFDTDILKLRSKVLNRDITNKYELYARCSSKKRNRYPFVNMILASLSCYKRNNKACESGNALYLAVVDALESFINKEIHIEDNLLFKKAITLGSPNIFLFRNSINAKHYHQLFFDFLTSMKGKQQDLLLDFLLDKEKESECESVKNLDENFDTSNEIILNWDNIDGKSPLFENSYKNRYKPPWRTSIDCIKNAIEDKQQKILQKQQQELLSMQPQQPSIGIENERLRNDGGCVRRIRRDDLSDIHDHVHQDQNLQDYSGVKESNGFDSPSLVASGFVMGVRCLPASTAITSLGSIISEGVSTSVNNVNNGNAHNITRSVVVNSSSTRTHIRQNNSQRLSIPLSDITAGVSSCHTLSSIATSWGTPVPITRTIPMDDILERQQQNGSSGNRETNGELSPGGEHDKDENRFSIRLKISESSEEEYFNGNNSSEDSNERLLEDDTDGESNEDENHCQRMGSVTLDGISNLRIDDCDASLVAKETLKTWKYVNCEFEGFGEDEEDGCENEEESEEKEGFPENFYIRTGG